MALSTGPVKYFMWLYIAPEEVPKKHFATLKLFLLYNSKLIRNLSQWTGNIIQVSLSLIYFFKSSKTGFGLECISCSTLGVNKRGRISWYHKEMESYGLCTPAMGGWDEMWESCGTICGLATFVSSAFLSFNPKTKHRSVRQTKQANSSLQLRKNISQKFIAYIHHHKESKSLLLTPTSLNKNDEWFGHWHKRYKAWEFSSGCFIYTRHFDKMPITRTYSV